MVRPKILSSLDGDEPVAAIEEPSSLVDLSARTTAMVPRMDLPEVILEVMC